MVDDQHTMSRRNVLKTTGVSLVAVGGLTTTSLADNTETEHEVIEEAKRIREKTGSQEKFYTYLENHGGAVTSTQNTFLHYNGESDNDSAQPQEIKESLLTTTLSLATFTDSALADYRVEISANGAKHDAGEKPEDSVTISWDSDDYDLKDDGTDIDNGPNVVLKKSTFSGAHWAYSDNSSCNLGCDLWFAVNTELTYEPGSSNRKVQATYQSVYNDAIPLSGFSVGSGGGVSFGSGASETDYKQIDRQVASE